VTVKDTVTVNDTVTVKDTIAINDTVTVKDTVTINDTVTVKDTITVSDTVTVKDTITINDTMTVKDTITIHDTVTTIPQLQYVQSDEYESTITIKAAYYLEGCTMFEMQFSDNYIDIAYNVLGNSGYAMKGTTFQKESEIVEASIRCRCVSPNISSWAEQGVILWREEPPTIATSTPTLNFLYSEDRKETLIIEIECILQGCNAFELSFYDEEKDEQETIIRNTSNYANKEIEIEKPRYLQYTYGCRCISPETTPWTQLRHRQAWGE
jgi:hypothetical protein